MTLLNTLQRKAVFVVAIILFFTIAINTAVLTYISYGKYENAIHAKTEALGVGLRDDLEKALNLGVPLYALEGLEAQLIHLTERDPAIGYAMIIDAAGTVLFHHRPEETGRVLEDAVTTQILTAKSDLTQPSGAHVDHAFALVDAEGGFVGALRIGMKSHVVKRQLYALLSWSVAIALLCFVLSMALVHASISRFISRPIRSMEGAAKQIASGSLIAEMRVTGNDELASLGNAINSISANLKEMIASVRNTVARVNQITGGIRDSSRRVLEVSDLQKKEIDETASSITGMYRSIEAVAATAGKLADSSGETSAAILQMRTSIGNVAQNSDTFDETAEGTASSVKELISAVNHIASSLESLSAASSEIASSIDEVSATTNSIEAMATESVGLADAVLENARTRGLKASVACTEGMGVIKDGMEAISGDINALGEKAGDIGRIVSIIDEIADQTKLLALNAAILAAQAGDEGQGFSVVAGEIKQLAGRTSLSTRDIGELIKAVQSEMTSSVRRASEGMKVVDGGLTLVGDVHEALNVIVGSAETSAEKARGIQQATSEEAVLIKEIQTAVASVSEQTEKISGALQEQTRGSAYILKAAEKVRTLSHEVKTATNEQSEGSRRISETSSDVAAQAGQIAEATMTQREKSEHIVESIERVRETTSALSDSSASLDEAIKSLGSEAATLLEEMRKFDI